MELKRNPIINSDFPDPDIIRVNDVYYMASTTMHYMPGCDILQSYDLMNWELIAHAYETLDHTEGQELLEEKEIYGKGMWAPSFRMHKGTFYIVFTSNDMNRTFLLTAQNPEGPWKKQFIEGFYYDNGLFFDEDNRVYIVHGQGVLYITELDADLKRAKENGLHRIIVEDEKEIPLGYEGSHLYKKDGMYYLFTCHMNGKGNQRKTQDCFMADSLEGEFRGICLIDDDMGYRNLGVAQGGMIDTPTGEWYAFMFQDRGALGRAPVLMPLHFEKDIPVIGGIMDEDPLLCSANGKVPDHVKAFSNRKEYQYNELNGNDDFIYEPDENGSIVLKLFWQFNHNPHPEFWSVTERKGAYRVKSGKLSPNLIVSWNTLTQRCWGAKSAASVIVDGTQLKEGDYAGISTFMGCYGAIALTRQENRYYLVMLGKTALDESIFGQFDYAVPGVEYARIPVKNGVVTLKAATDFTLADDSSSFYFYVENGWEQLGIRQKLYFKMDFFTGCRFGLFYFSTQETGGIVDFMDFRYEGNE